MQVTFELSDTVEIWVLDQVPRVGDWVMLASQPISYRVKRVTWFLPAAGDPYVTVEVDDV